MRSLADRLLLLGLVLGGAVSAALLHRSPTLALAAGLPALLLALEVARRRSRCELRARHCPLHPPRWEEGPPTPPDAQTEAEILSLGYRPLGSLRESEGVAAVYLLASLPVYLLLRTDGRAGAPDVELVTFFAGGGRLTTVSCPVRACWMSWTGGPEPRLIQLRPGGTPAALDGQHLGTVRAWVTGKRRVEGASREHLVRCLQADQAELERLLAGGSRPRRVEWLRGVAGRPPGVLRF